MNKLNLLIAFMLMASMLVKGQSTTAKKPISITKLSVYEKANRLNIEWSADGGNESNYWQVQGSADGKKFSTIAIVLGPDPGKTGEQYAFKGKLDKTNNYYRVVHIDPSGQEQKSDIIQMAEQVSLLSPTSQE
ncbi:hypothetical protein BH11BAC4_BH11BAC4_24730 [soil metagenome]